MKDLFGNELTEQEAYDLLKRKSTQPRGYAAPPGTGPAGETCRTCKHRIHRGNSEGRGRGHQKCAKHPRPTHGPATDILAKAPACRLWEKLDEEVEGVPDDMAQGQEPSTLQESASGIARK